MIVMLSSDDRRIVVDVAGGDIGGIARWRGELDAHLAATSRPVRVIGRGRRLTGRWLPYRERLAAGSAVAFAANNVSFAVSGRQRRVLLHNALHFLYPRETGVLRRMPTVWRAQITVVRQTVRRADQVVVPCSAMAERVQFWVPSLRERLVVQVHPISPIGPRIATEKAFILVPVSPGRYKNLFAQLRLLADVLDWMQHPAHVVVTAAATDLPENLAAEPRIQPIGIVSHMVLSQQWRTALAAFFPSTLEAFGYPLAEARAYGVPVLAPFSAQAAELAGSALRGYSPSEPHTLADAIEGIDEPVTPDPSAFDRDRYFDRLFADTLTAHPTDLVTVG